MRGKKRRRKEGSGDVNLRLGLTCITTRRRRREGSTAGKMRLLRLRGRKKLEEGEGRPGKETVLEQLAVGWIDLGRGVREEAEAAAPNTTAFLNAGRRPRL